MRIRPALAQTGLGNLWKGDLIFFLVSFNLYTLPGAAMGLVTAVGIEFTNKITDGGSRRTNRGRGFTVRAPGTDKNWFCRKKFKVRFGIARHDFES